MTDGKYGELMEYLDTNSTDVETWEEARFMATLDYELNKGAMLTVGEFTTYIDDDSVAHCELALVRLEHTSSTALHHSIDEYLDPYWEISVLSEHKGESAWTFGPSYRVLEMARGRVESVEI